MPSSTLVSLSRVVSAHSIRRIRKVGGGELRRMGQTAQRCTRRRRDTRPLASSRRDYPDQRAQLQTPANRQAATKQKVNRTTTLKTSKTEGYQLFWFLLCNGNRVDRLAASHEHYAPPVQVRIRHKRCPLRATPIYSVSTLSWLRSALKRLPSFALDSCSLVTSLSGPKRKTSCYHPPINCESVEIRFVTARFAEKSLNHPLPKHLRPV